MPAGYSEIFLEQGADFNMSVTLDEIDGTSFNLSSFSASSQMRKSYYSSSVAATFSVNTGANTSLGIITLSLDGANTANIYPGRYVYDVYVTNANNRIRVLEGIATVSPQVTKTSGML